MRRHKRKKRALKRAAFTAVIAVMLSATAGNVVITAEAENSTVTQKAPETAPRERSIHIVIEEPDTIEEWEDLIPLETEPVEEKQDNMEAAGLKLSTSDQNALLKIAMAEAEDQGTKGMALVMRVVLNRVASKDWPNTVEGVITQKGQFEPVSNGRYNKVTPDARCREALDMVLSGWDESEGAEYFCMAGSSRWHEKNLKRLFQYRDHVFYK